MHIGYCRVSTGKQAASIEAQEAQLKKAGCEIVYKHIYKVDRSTISRMMTEVRLKQDLKGGVL